jgi:AcrR family transcriptional regulator
MKAIAPPVKSPAKSLSTSAKSSVKKPAGKAAGKSASPAAAPAPTPARKAAAPVRPYHHGNLRDELIRCGKAQLEAVGLADLSLRQIAAEVGVSQVAPKHHFGNKEGLLAAIAASGYADLAEFRLSRLKALASSSARSQGATQTKASTSAPAPLSEQRMRVLLSSYVVFATQHPALFHLMFAPQFKAPELYVAFNDSAAQSFRLLSSAAGEFLAELKHGHKGLGVGADEAARIAWMCLHGVAMLLIERRTNPLGAARVSREALTQRTLDVVFAGIRSLALA